MALANIVAFEKTILHLRTGSILFKDLIKGCQPLKSRLNIGIYCTRVDNLKAITNERL
jgi:hypothetical protein